MLNYAHKELLNFLFSGRFSKRERRHRGGKSFFSRHVSATVARRGSGPAFDPVTNRYRQRQTASSKAERRPHVSTEGGGMSGVIWLEI